jgi:malate dehydrogenase
MVGDCYQPRLKFPLTQKKRQGLVKANVKTFRDQGQAMDNFAKKSIKVVTLGVLANMKALLCSHYAPSIPKENFSALTRQEQDYFVQMLAHHAHVEPREVKNTIVWGNYSSTQFPDASQATIGGQRVSDIIGDGLTTAAMEAVQKNTRGTSLAALVDNSLGSAMMAAEAACDHMRAWFRGTGQT